MNRYGASMRRACAAIQLNRVVYLYRSVARDNTGDGRFITRVMPSQAFPSDHAVVSVTLHSRKLARTCSAAVFF